MLNKKRMKQEIQSYYTPQLLIKNNRERMKSFHHYKKVKSINKITKGSFYEHTKENYPVIVLRLCGMNERISKPVYETLKEWRLLKLFSAVIVDYNQENFNKLTEISNYVTWGFPDKKTIISLVNKRAKVYSKVEKSLNDLDNNEIELALGKSGILCIEDIIHELNSHKSKVRKIVMDYLGFFLLSPCDEIKEDTIKPFYNGGNTGYRGDKINSIINKMI